MKARWRWALGAAPIVAACGAAALGQTPPSNAPAVPAPAEQNTPSVSSAANVAAPPLVEPPPPPPPEVSNAAAETNAAPAAPAKTAAAKPPPAPPAVKQPAHGQIAYLRALDKVTAETIMFAAPLGQPIRYKNLVFTVKACETGDPATPEPQTSAYLVIDEAPIGADGIRPPPPRRIFTGWMFANSPGLNPLQHPVYDAWLIACQAASPAA